MATATKTARRSKKTAAKAPAAKRAVAKARAGTPSPARPAGVAVRSFARTILYVKDWAPTIRFYTDVLGLKLAYPAEEGWAEFATGTTAFCLHGGRAADAKTEAVCSVGFAVENFDAACAALRAKGVKVGDPHSPCGGL